MAEEALRMHMAAYGNDPVLANMLDTGGEYAWRSRGEEHMWTPDAIAKLQHSTRANNFSTYKEYAQIINDQSKRHMTLRGLFEFKIDPSKAISIDEVEPAKEIVKRFATGAMSLGSISTEAHATLAVAMNRIGGKSNTGEGGEDAARYRNELKGIPIKKGDTLKSVIGAENVEVDLPLQDGDSLRSRIGMVTQDTSLLHRSMRDNILYGRPDAGDDAMIAAAKRAEAHDFIGHLSDLQGRTGYDAHVGERG
eukprot:gene82-109_t